MTHYALVLGATSAIAQSLISKFALDGKPVVAAGRNLDELHGLFGHMPLVKCVCANATDGTSVAELYKTIAEQQWMLDQYAHCVGSILVAPLAKTSDAQLLDVLQVNLLSAMYGLKGFVSHCKSMGHSGAAVLVSTCATNIGVANHEAIAAAKGGVEALARSAAATYASDGIRVNVVAPGLTESPIAGAFLKSELMRQASEKQYPISGINQPNDVAAAMHWLLSEQASRITGTILNVDGGFRNIRPLVK